MAFSLTVDKLESDGTIRVRHVFFGDTLEECEALRDAHGDGCKAFGPALDHDRVIEEFETINEVPEWEDD